MKLKPFRFAPREDGKCICGLDPADISPNSAGRFFCPQSGHEWVEDKPEEVGAGTDATPPSEETGGETAPGPVVEGAPPTGAGPTDEGKPSTEQDPTVCPNCGGAKSPSANVCRTCYDAGRSETE